MKTAIKTIFFTGLTILLLFVLGQNKEIKKLHQNEKEYNEALYFLDSIIDSLNIEIKDLLDKVEKIKKDSTPEIIFNCINSNFPKSRRNRILSLS